MSQCSERFNDAFATGSGGIVRTCQCGVTTYCSDSHVRAWFDEGEYEKYEIARKAYPYRFIATDYEPSTLTIGGQEVVIGCECKIAFKCEQWIEAHARQLTAYLNARAKHIKAMAANIKEVESP